MTTVELGDEVETWGELWLHGRDLDTLWQLLNTISSYREMELLGRYMTEVITNAAFTEDTWGDDYLKLYRFRQGELRTLH